MNRSPGCVIDFHAHLMIPELYAITGPHTMFVKSNTDPTMGEDDRKGVREREAVLVSRMSDVTERIARMDAMGVDMQVLSSSLVQQITYWAEPQESLRLERMFNDRMAAVVAANPKRLIGLGGVPLAAPWRLRNSRVACVSSASQALASRRRRGIWSWAMRRCGRSGKRPRNSARWSTFIRRATQARALEDGICGTA